MLSFPFLPFWAHFSWVSRARAGQLENASTGAEEREFPVSFHLPLACEARRQLLLLCSLISFLSTEREEERISLMFINI